jgi:hypothetical protein
MGHHVTAGCRSRARPAAVASRLQGRVGTAVKLGPCKRGSMDGSPAASGCISGLMWNSSGACPAMGLVGGIQAHATLWRACWGLLSLGHGMVWPSQAVTDSRPCSGLITYLQISCVDYGSRWSYSGHDMVCHSPPCRSACPLTCMRVCACI